jgi:hypothetical protein
MANEALATSRVVVPAFPVRTLVTRTTLRVLLWLGSALALTSFLFWAWRSLTAGPSSDPLERAILDQATRWTSDLAPYSEPAGRAVPLMPGFPFAVSILARLFDIQAWEPRLVSLMATLAAAVLAGWIVSGETGNPMFGVASGGLLLMSQGILRGPLALARPETLMLLLVLLACQALRRMPGMLGALLASLALAAACFTHPAGLWFSFAALLHLAVFDRSRLLVFAPAFALAVCAGQLQFSRAFGPWFNFLGWDAGIQALRFTPGALLRLVGTQLLGTFGVLTLATVLSFALPIQPWRGAVGIWTWVAFAAVAAAISATQSGGAPVEAMRASAVALAIVGPISLQRVTQHLSNWPGGSRMGGQAVVLTALALQFVTLFASS